MKIKHFLLLTIIASLSINAFGQKIKESTYDKFLKKRRIETTAVTIDMKLASVLTVSIRSFDTSIFIKFSGRGYSVGIVGEDDIAILLFTNDSTLKLKSKGLQTYERNGGANGLDKVFYYEYLASLSDIEKLSNSKTASIRINSDQHYTDIDITQKKRDLINKLCQIFIKEYNETQ